MKRLSVPLVVLCIILFCLPALGLAADQDFSTAPPATPPAKKLRLGYLQGGIYKDYLPVFRSLVNGLVGLGWLENPIIPDTDAALGSKGLWDWLAANGNSKYIEFASDAFYDADWSAEKRPQVQTALIDRLKTKKDIAVMICMGTWAGQDVVTDAITTPTLVFSTSDPIGSKIIKSLHDSGYDHLWARSDPTRYERQVRLFQDIIGFNRLGIVYEDSPVGRSFASVDKIEQVAKERGFKIVTCFAPFSQVDENEATRRVIDCHKKLAPKVDALYITNHRGIKTDKMHELMAPLFEYNIPTFSQAGSNEVRYGALLSISQANFLYVGKFYAETVARVLNGAKPRDLSQVFESPPKIAINLGTAELIGYDPPVDILGAADEIYEDIAQ
ncbi:MAG: ABC transporter substrate-binding protein [Desulfovibrionaceae bacterium]